MTPTQSEGDRSENSLLKSDRRTVLKSITFAATASIGGCLADASNGSQTETPTTHLPDADAQQFRRIERQNVYDLSYRWYHRNRSWQIGLSLSKDRYRSTTRASRSISRCFSDAVNGGLPSDVPAELSRHINSAGIESPVDRLHFATAFVRSLEYREDEEDTGELEYPKYVEETLIENGGDCEDFAALLAGILSVSPFDHDVELLVFAGHVGLGVDPSPFAEDIGPLLSVDGREYLYVDANMNVPLGRVPPEYQDPGVIARYNGRWQVTDLTGLKEHVTTSISNDRVDGVAKYV